MNERTSWKETRARRLRNPAAAAGYQAARQSYEWGQQVRALREAHGLTQLELAVKMGTTQSVIARLEAGGSRPSLSTLERIASAVGARVEIRFREPEAAAS